MTYRPFTDFLREQRNGLTMDELGAALNELVRAVADHGGTGTLTYTITIKPLGRADHGAVEAADEIRMKKPTGTRASSIFFVTPEFNLTRKNQTEPELPLRAVEMKESANG